jgi:hypothetical protein
LFRSEFFFRTTRELEYLFFLSRESRNFFPEFNIRFVRKKIMNETKNHNLQHDEGGNYMAETETENRMSTRPHTRCYDPLITQIANRQIFICLHPYLHNQTHNCMILLTKMGLPKKRFIQIYLRNFHFYLYTKVIGMMEAGQIGPKSNRPKSNRTRGSFRSYSRSPRFPFAPGRFALIY